LNRKYAEGGGVSEYWQPINESSIYRGVHDYSMDGIDDEQTLLQGQVWIKFKSIPKGVTNLPYEVKRAIESDFEYYGYSNTEYRKSVDLTEGSWWDYYIDFQNLTYQELEELLLKLPEQVAESLEEQGIEGYGELGFNTYGNYIDVELSSDNESEEDEYEYAKGGEVSKPKRGLNYGKKDDVYFDVVTLLDAKGNKTKGIFGQEKPKVQTMSLDSLMEFLRRYETDIRYQVDLPIELFSKESLFQYRNDVSKFKFIRGKIYKLGKEDLLQKKIENYIDMVGKSPSQKVLNKLDREVESAPEKTFLQITINSQQLLEKGGSIGFKGLSAKVAKRYEGKSVAPKYQSQYGTTYSKSEAKEVGDKVAGKVYWNQQGRKMAKGGLTEHGLKVGDKIERKLDAEGSVIKVKNKRENAFVVLDSGFRNPIPKMAKGGGVYSSDDLYELLVFDVETGVFLGSERFRAKNIREAQEMGEEYEDKYKKKYRANLRFKVQLAPSMFQEKGGLMANGGGVDYNKTWEVIGINLNGKMFKERITLGRMSDKEDVKNALRRRTDLNIREVTSINEVFANGGGVDELPSNLQKRVDNLKGKVKISKEEAIEAYKYHLDGAGASTIGYEFFDADTQRESLTYGNLAIDLGRFYSGKPLGYRRGDDDFYTYKMANGGGISGIEDIIRG
jgi:hypothetical protein